MSKAAVAGENVTRHNGRRPRMQTKISAFFKPKPEPNSQILHHTHDSGYQTRNGSNSQNIEGPQDRDVTTSLAPTNIATKNLNNKRNYAQLHLNLGQSDFLLHTCSTCGFRYARGDKGDEKVHKEFHKDYTQGVQFKGWRNERVVHLSSDKKARVVLLLDSDPLAHKKKLQNVVEMMEMDLGSGWLIQKLCKVYLYIFNQRIAGCLVAEQIKAAYRVISSPGRPTSVSNTNANNDGTSSPMLRPGATNVELDLDLMGAILLEEEAVPANCGIRAIWVASSMRRKHIATKLLDAVRMSFCEDGLELRTSQLAFSDPTSTGRALAYRYFGTTSFLAYKIE